MSARGFTGSTEGRAAVLERGVYELPFTHAGGARQVVAVDSRGRLVGQLAIPAEFDSPHEATDTLRAWLDRVDPVGRNARFAVIRGGAA